MASKKITVDNLAITIKKILDEYQEDCYETIDEAGKKVSQKGRTALKNRSMELFDSRNGEHKYAKGWSVAEEKGRLYVSYEIHNRNQPTLTHLLERGHALHQGGRTRAFPHIEPMREILEREFEEEIINDLSSL